MRIIELKSLLPENVPIDYLAKIIISAIVILALILLILILA